MILITGATGHLGKAVVDFLLKKVPASKIAVLVRDKSRASDLLAKGVDVREGDYNDYASLVRSFTGIEKLYLVSGTDIATRLQQHTNAVKAAKAAGVKHVIYTSFQRRNETESSPLAPVAGSHIGTEQVLKASGLPYTILKHTLYLDMIPMFIGDQVLKTGIIFLPAGEGKVSFASRLDMAEAAAAILTTPGHENQVYEISGNTSYSYRDIAQIISETTGQKITYVSPAPEVYRQELGKAGVPAEYAGIFASFSEAIKEGEFDNPDTTLEKLLGRKTTTPGEFLSTLYIAEKQLN